MRTAHHRHIDLGVRDLFADAGRDEGEEASRQRPMEDRRREKRIKEENRVLIEIPGVSTSTNGHPANALTQDISLGGARLVTDRYYELESHIKVTLYLSRSKQVIKVRAQVRWAREIESGIYELGVQFEHGIPTSLLALINHLFKKEHNVPTHVEK